MIVSWISRIERVSNPTVDNSVFFSLCNIRLQVRVFLIHEGLFKSIILDHLMHSIHYEHILCISWISCVFHICQLLVNHFYKVSIHFSLSLFIFRNYLKLNYIVLKFPTLIVGLFISQFCQLFMNFEALILSTCKLRLFFF